MQAAPSVPVAQAGEPRDWLGYQRYADALWTRIVHNFALDSDARSAAAAAKKPDGRHLPTGDPLVVGVYGEWGVGKSRLLELMYQLAARQNVEDCAQRVRDPQAYEASPALRLTVPVWFHPWKYEHEPHLAVPLLMHLAEATQRTLGSAASLEEQTLQLLKDRGEDVSTAVERVKQVAATLQAAARIAHKVAGNGLVKTTASLAAGYFGFGAAAERSLSWVEKTAEKFLPDAKDDDKPVEKAAVKEPGLMGRLFGKSGAVLADATPEASADGRYYYNVHRYLSELTHIDGDTAARLGHQSLRHDIHLNFVVFVDDLDRCLPEKAVEVLEVIKTVLNVESFAFVIALDDEVIERGISYRYREYRFQNAKPEMPITGFEYLEKIVHLPFRLPQLTRAQAVEFLRRQEERLLAPTASDPAAAAITPVRLWFVPDPATGGLQPSPLVHLLLDSFDAFVPRKLGRTLELMHQFQQVFTARGTPIQPPPSGFSTTSSAADARMVLCCVLLQLFAPEIFRLLRRRPELFGHWMKAYLEQDQTHPVFIWQKTAGDQQMGLEVSDGDLYRWAALGSVAGTPKQLPRPTGYAKEGKNDEALLSLGPKREEWSNYVDRLTASDRYSVEQVRLPLATALIGFREMQRHAFAPIRLGGAMAFATAWTAGAVPRLQEYLNLFNDQVLLFGSATVSVSARGSLAVGPGGASTTSTPAPIPQAPGPAPAVTPTPMATAAGSIDAVIRIPTPASVLSPTSLSPTARPVRQIQPGQLLELLSSSDASTRAALPDRLGLQPGELIDEMGVQVLARVLRNHPTMGDPRSLEALTALAPFLDAAMVEGARPWPVTAALAMPSATDDPGACIEISRPYVTLAKHGLDRALGLDAALDVVRSGLLNVLANLEVSTSTREAASDQLSIVGDSRFSFDPARLWLPGRRAQVVPADDEPIREATGQEEPIIGFVRMRAGSFNLSAANTEGEEHHLFQQVDDFFVGRALVTIQQYEEFVNDDGYRRDECWDEVGKAWLKGDLDDLIRDASSTSALAIRPPVKRLQPRQWSGQLGTPLRAVTGVCWFEARAYAAWLSYKLTSELESAGLSAYQACLPLDDEWMRTVCARSLTSHDARLWPWDSLALSQPQANTLESRIGHPSNVGMFSPSTAGIFDLAGNVWEWMDDFYGGAQTRLSISQVKSIQNVQQIMVSLRGGCWAANMGNASRMAQFATLPWDSSDQYGFRLVLAVRQQTVPT